MSLFGGNTSQISRQFDRQANITAGAAAATATAVDVRSTAGLQMIVPAGAASQSVAVHVCDQPEGTYVPLNDSDGAVTFSVVASNAYDLPEALFSCHYVKFIAATPFAAVLLIKG